MSELGTRRSRNRLRRRGGDRPYHLVRVIGPTAAICTNRSDTGMQLAGLDNGAPGGCFDAAIGRATARDAGWLDRKAQSSLPLIERRTANGQIGRHRVFETGGCLADWFYIALAQHQFSYVVEVNIHFNTVGVCRGLF